MSNSIFGALNFSIRVVHSNQSQHNKDRARLDTISDYIAQNYRRHVSIEEIAGIAYLQPGYFCRFFKKCMGITFLEYQNELRLSFIYLDIISTDDSIKDILERLEEALFYAKKSGRNKIYTTIMIE